MPTLDVAVSDVPRPLGPWVRTPADARVSRLLYRPILASDSEDAAAGKVPGQLAAAVESSRPGPSPDLPAAGRRILVRRVAAGHRRRRDAAHSSIGAIPNSPKFQARWADLLGPGGVVRRAPGGAPAQAAPAQAGLRGSTGRSARRTPGSTAGSRTAGQERLLVSDGPFRCVRFSDRSIELSGPAISRRGRPRPRRWQRSGGLESSGTPRQGHGRGPDRRARSAWPPTCPPIRSRALRPVPEIKIGRYTQPLVHLIALDGRNPRAQEPIAPAGPLLRDRSQDAPRGDGPQAASDAGEHRGRWTVSQGQLRQRTGRQAAGVQSRPWP